jgi:hypothetical protein
LQAKAPIINNKQFSLFHNEMTALWPRDRQAGKKTTKICTERKAFDRSDFAFIGNCLKSEFGVQFSPLPRVLLNGVRRRARTGT